MQIETTCNTADEVLFAHIKTNSQRKIPWLKSIPEHDGHAVIMGGGPSVVEWIEEIRYRQNEGQTIFALNGAAKFLTEHGITPNHLVVVDARESNKQFLGYAKHTYLASQCHPSLFGGNVTLWHQEYPDNMPEFEAALPDTQPEHTLIGGGTTVGLSALALVYALGYRKMHLYGYDSSYRNGESHAYKQYDPQNVPCIATVAGKRFKTSLAMARQAELFPELSDTLIDLGCLITIRGDGLLPWTSQMAAVKPEAIEESEKYRRMWEHKEYRICSPGERIAEQFLELEALNSTSEVIDFGCGSGRGGKKIAELTGCKVTFVDFAENCLDEELRGQVEFVTADLTKPIPVSAPFGYCTDVMEHLPPESVDAVIQNIMGSAKKVFFQISTIKDHLGSLIGHPLHLTVKPYSWWLEKLSQYGEILWSQEQDIAALFYIDGTTPKGTHHARLGSEQSPILQPA